MQYVAVGRQLRTRTRRALCEEGLPASCVWVGAFRMVGHYEQSAGSSLLDDDMLWDCSSFDGSSRTGDDELLVRWQIYFFCGVHTCSVFLFFPKCNGGAPPANM